MPSTEYWLSDEVYQELLAIVGENFPDDLNTFIGYFQQNQDGYWGLKTDLASYTTFLDGLLGSGEWQGTDFVSWATYTPGTSGQGGGGMKIIW